MLIGNLTRDPEIRYTPKGTAVAELGLAINRTWKGDNGEKKEEVTFVDVTLWGKTAELAEQYLKKGRPVYIEGRLQLESWEDKKTGEKRSKLKVIGEEMQFLGSREDGGGERREERRSAPASESRPPAKPFQRPAKPAPDPDLDVESDDIPF